MWWIYFLVVILTISGNFHPGMEDKPVRDFFVSFEMDKSISSMNFKVRRHTPLIHILRHQDSGLYLDLEVGRHTINLDNPFY